MITVSRDILLFLLIDRMPSLGGPPPAPTPELTRDYCGPFIYENGTLERILFDGGYITFDEANSNTPEYHFYTKDHLGNIRVVQTANGAIEEVNHYYPYGSLFGESTGLANTVQPYKYSGKELDRMHGLNMFDHGATAATDEITPHTNSPR